MFDIVYRIGLIEMVSTMSGRRAIAKTAIVELANCHIREGIMSDKRPVCCDRPLSVHNKWQP